MWVLPVVVGFVFITPVISSFVALYAHSLALALDDGAWH